jgi:ATPase subunit of ABC transporter with duplicated ATPase domains
MQFQNPLTSFSSVIPAYYARLASGERLAEIDEIATEEVVSAEEGINYQALTDIQFKNLSFTVGKEDKIAFLGNEMAITALFRILMEEETPDSGDFKWGVSITKSYFPHDNTPYFNNCTLSIIDWLAQYSKETTETYLRGFLGRMLFSNESVFKPVNVLSGGEKVRCMFARMMLFGSNVLLLDQPTDHLDLESISAVNNGLSGFRGNVLFTSHDYELVNTVANRIIELRPDRYTDYSGTYDEFVERKRKLSEQ